MTNPTKWKSEVKKVNSLSWFLGHGKIFLLLGGVIITVCVILIYHYSFKDILLDLEGIKRVILGIILGFGVSASLTGVIGSLMGRRVNVGVLKDAPTPDDYQKVIKEYLPQLEKAKEEMKHYLEISAMILVVTAIKDILAYFIG